MALKKSQELAQELATKRQRIQVLLPKVRETTATADELKEFDGISGEITQLNENYVKAVALDALETSNEAALKELKEAPVTEMTFTDPATGEVKTAGMTPAGVSIVGRNIEQPGNQLSVVYEEGALGLDEKTMKHISTKDYKMAFRKYLRSKRDSDLSLAEMKLLQEGTDTAGGFLVPDDIQSRVIQKAPTPTRVAGYVSRLQTSRDRIVFPKVNYAADDIYTSGIRVKWTGEVPSSATTHRVTDPLFAQVGIPIHTAMLSMPLTNDMIEDSAFPIVQWSADKFRETIDLLYDNMILNGSGQGQPAGILLNPGGADQPAVVNSGDANLLKADGLINLTYALPEQYDENARLVFNKTSTGAAIALLKDSNNRYLFARGITDDGLAVGRPTSLLGYPFNYSGFMPNVAANAYPIVFGDFRGYFLVERVGFSIQVLREIYAETNQQLLLGRVRIGGQVAEDWRLKIQKVSA